MILERLTHLNKSANKPDLLSDWLEKLQRFINATAHAEFSEAIEKLSAYEDSGLTPDEVAELAQAKRDGRCVVLPNIPYNKTLYWIWDDEIMPVLYRGINGGCIDADKKYRVTCNMVTKKLRTFTRYFRGRYDGINGYPAGDKRMFYADDIGKTVFLTHQAAEAALKGASHENQNKS